jgi:hypothetical protein
VLEANEVKNGHHALVSKYPKQSAETKVEKD